MCTAPTQIRVCRATEDVPASHLRAHPGLQVIVDDVAVPTRS